MIADTIWTPAHASNPPAPDAPLREWAVWYAAVLGWHVFPLKPGTKIPFSKKAMGVPETAKGGFCLATTSRAAINKWWKRWPTANIGLAIEASGLAIIEADPRHNGPACLDTLLRELGVTLDTVEAVSASGGPHYYFTAAPDLKRAIGHRRGVDFLPSGYAVAAPSRRADGSSYAWEPGRAPWERTTAPLPQALHNNLPRRDTTHQADAAPPYAVPLLDGEGVPPGLQRFAEAGAFEGQRNSSAFWLACRLHQECGNTADARATLDVFGAACDPPMDRHELAQIWQSAGRAQPYSPRMFVKEAPRKPEAPADEPLPQSAPVPELREQRRASPTCACQFEARLAASMWGPKHIRTYRAFLSEFDVKMGKPYPNGRPAAQPSYGINLARVNEDTPNHTNAALAGLAKAHYLSQEKQYERDQSGRVRKTWYLRQPPIEEAYNAWCDNPALFAPPPPLRTSLADKARYAERKAIKEALAEALAVLEDAVQTVLDAPEKPENVDRLKAAWTAYTDAKAAAAPRQRGRPRSQPVNEPQGTPTIVDLDRKNRNGLEPEVTLANFFGFSGDEPEPVVPISIADKRHRFEKMWDRWKQRQPMPEPALGGVS